MIMMNQYLSFLLAAASEAGQGAKLIPLSYTHIKFNTSADFGA